MIVPLIITLVVASPVLTLQQWRCGAGLLTFKYLPTRRPQFQDHPRPARDEKYHERFQ
jgi:hypothetical protein